LSVRPRAGGQGGEREGEGGQQGAGECLHRRGCRSGAPVEDARPVAESDRSAITALIARGSVRWQASASGTLTMIRSDA
jgi:hypothetical protein